MTDSVPKIRLRNLCKSFGKKQVLTGVDMDICEGESVVIIGGSGSGKSVTLKCILGLLSPDEGSIQINGIETIGISKQKRYDLNRKIAMLFQGAALFDSLTIWENVVFGLSATEKISRQRAHEIAIYNLGLVGMKPDTAHMLPASLSIGMQKRVGLARAIAVRPDIIFYDEPTTGLDPIMADIINDLIIKTNKETNATALSITHDMASARKIGDRIAMLYDGKIIWSGATGDIDTSGNPYVNQFIHGELKGPIRLAGRRQHH